MKGTFAIFLREILILRRRIVKQLLSYAISPLLFLIAFGWGLGSRVTLEGTNYLTFLIPGLIAMSSMNQSFAISSEINIARFYWHIFEEFQASPVSEIAIATGEVMAGMLRGVLSTTVILVLSFIFGVKLKIGVPLFLSVLVNCFTFSSLAIITSMVVRSHSDQAILSNFVITPMAFLCGTFFSLKSLPAWAYYLINVLPLTHTTRAIRASALGKNIPWNSLFFAFALGVLFFIIGVKTVSSARD